MTAPASVLGVKVCTFMVAREVVELARHPRGGPFDDEGRRLVELFATESAVLRPLLLAADEQKTPRYLAVFTVLGTACRACGWPIEGEHATDDRGAVHPACRRAPPEKLRRGKGST